MSVVLAGLALAAAPDLANRRAPGFSLPDITFKQHDLVDYRGRIVLLDIMQTNCPHCRTLARTLDRVKARYGDRVAVFSVVNPPDTQATVARFLKETNMTATVLFDCGQMAASYLKVTPQNPSVELPHLFVIDQQGIIRHHYAYQSANKPIFEGDALFPVIDALLKK